MSGWPRLAALASFVLASPVLGQAAIAVRDAGPGLGPRVVAQILAAPHAVIAPGPGTAVIRRDSAFSQSVVSVGRDVVVDGTVHGDLLVIGADLYMHPGGRVDGRAIAVGGGVYESMLASTGRVISYPDFTYDVDTTGAGYALRYRAFPTDTFPAIKLPNLYGLRLPSYDRMNGLSVPIAPTFAIGRALTVEPRLTYRSQLGRLDPSGVASLAVDRRTTLRAEAGRGTFTNDGWIWSDPVNSYEFGLFGHDARNYYRADQGTVTLIRRFEGVSTTFDPYIGARIESAKSLPRDSTAAGGPWTLFHNNGSDDNRRPNPSIDPATITSALAGARVDVTRGALTFAGRVDGEVGSTSSGDYGLLPGEPRHASSFGQLTVDGTIGFPTFGTQSIRVNAHVVATASDRTPRQRYAYVGGTGTIATLELLERGGDQLVYFDARYSIPLTRFALPVVGPPTVSLHEIIAGADVGRFPTLAQATGVRLSGRLVYAELLVDPVHRHGMLDVGISIGR